MSDERPRGPLHQDDMRFGHYIAERKMFGSSPSGIVFEFHGINLRLTYLKSISLLGQTK